MQSLESIMRHLFQEYTAPAVLLEVTTAMHREFVYGESDAVTNRPYVEAIELIKKAENRLRDAGC